MILQFGGLHGFVIQLCFSFTEMVPASGNTLGSIIQTFVRSVRNIHFSSAYSFLCYTRKIYYFHKWNTFSKISICITYECWPLNISLQYADPCLSELDLSLSSLYHSFLCQILFLSLRNSVTFLSLELTTIYLKCWHC